MNYVVRQVGRGLVENRGNTEITRKRVSLILEDSFM